MPADPYPESDLPLPCPICGYDLRGAASERCPECGTGIDLHQLRGTASIPWQLEQTGRFRAFWRTAWRVLRRPGELVPEVERAVDLRRARSFQVVCCVIGALVPAAGLAAWLCMVMSNAVGGLPLPGRAGWISDAVLVASTLPATFLWVLFATGVPSYFCHPRHESPARQASAIALSYYASAALLLVPVATLATVPLGFATTYFLQASGAPDTMIAWSGSLILAALAWIFLLWRLIGFPTGIVRRGLRRSRLRAASLILTSLLAWPILFVLIGLGVVFLVFYLQVVYHSLVA